MVYKTFLTHTGVYYGSMRDGAAYGLLTEVNELAAQGVHTGSAEIRIEIPVDMDKSRMHSIRNHIAKAVEKLETEGFQLEELHIAGEKCAALRVPQIVITAAGETERCHATGNERSEQFRTACKCASVREAKRTARKREGAESAAFAGARCESNT